MHLFGEFTNFFVEFTDFFVEFMHFFVATDVYALPLFFPHICLHIFLTFMHAFGEFAIFLSNLRTFLLNLCTFFVFFCRDRRLRASSKIFSEAKLAYKGPRYELEGPVSYSNLCFGRGQR